MWYKPNTWEWVQKMNPAQGTIARQEGDEIDSGTPITYLQAFDRLETVNRGTNMIVSACSSLDYDIKDSLSASVASGTKVKTLNNLLNFRPNPYQSAQEFRKNLFTDYILEGNCFIYYDGAFMYHLPACSVTVQSDPKTFVKGYRYIDTNFTADEVMHFKDLSSESIYRGKSRLTAADRSIKILAKMQAFQESFFKNGAIPGMVFVTENTLSQVAKKKTIETWAQTYSPTNGARKPMILDSGLKLAPLTQSSFKDMDFDQSIETHDTKVLKALGVPPILLNGGNNANISPNLRLFYLETVMPIVRSYVSALERFFGYDIEAITANVSALQPELKDVAAYHATLVNAGILTPNEARIELRYKTLPGNDEVRIPANIAGSAGDPSQGGAPKKPKPEKEQHG